MDRILLIVGSNVGDTICTTPAIKILRQYLPQAKIGLITSSEMATQIFQDNPSIDHIYTLPKVSEIKKIATEYEVAIDLHKSPVSKDYFQELKIPLYTTEGPDPLHLRIHPLEPIYKIFPESKTLAFPDRYDFFLREEHEIAIQNKLQHAGVGLNQTEVLLGIHMGCGKVATRALKFWRRRIASYRTWPFEYYCDLHQELSRQHPNMKFIFTGTKGEQRIVKRYFKKAKNVVDLTEKTSLHELAALMNRCNVFLTGDTGPMHLAACTKVPLVALFGSTIPEVTGPYPLRNDIICLQAQSMKLIQPAQVQEAINLLLFSRFTN